MTIAVKQEAVTGLEETVALLCARVQDLLARQASRPGQRILIALAGVPGSGKSTVSAALLRALPYHGIENAVVVPMDGFHYSKAALSRFNDPDFAFRRRGAPFTFDVAGFLRLVMALKKTPVTSAGEPEVIIHAPSFGHAIQDPVIDDIAISSRTKVAVIEGNYVLLNEGPWSKVADLVDESWFVDVSPDVAKERLVRRHLQAGIEQTREAAAHRAEENDMPNGQLIRSKLIEPDVRILN
ncbi:putative kinase [Diplogelasinospora grovesii]|uniref:Kinase n=1 Tax=Diplogelasinospora grovesii TaxID=303347 RepID=A0AAN6NEN2_9PEZI|nr:putative kinase [Diplogelasinospora grovesii]